MFRYCASAERVGPSCVSRMGRKTFAKSPPIYIVGDINLKLEVRKQNLGGELAHRSAAVLPGLAVQPIGV